jgi:DNA-binding CsgD family transcriptional regulator
MNCLSCQDYNECGSLCERAQAFVSQDEVKLREYPIGIVHYGNNIEKPIKITKTEEKILTLTENNYKREHICKLLEISNQSLRFHLSNMRFKKLIP